MGINDLGMIAGVFHGGKGVGMSPYGIKLLGDLKGRPPGGPFENHVLD